MNIYGLSIHTVAALPDDYWEPRMPQRTIRAGCYLRREDQLRCLGAGALMHRVLGIDERDLRYSPTGKPYVPGRGGFNISHGGDWIVLCAGDGPVGIDIEPMEPKNLELAQQVTTADEWRWMQEDPLIRFHLLWTCKESILKATGLGLQADPAQLSVLPLDSPKRLDGTPWHTAWMLHDGCAITCAATEPIDRLEFEEILLQGGDLWLPQTPPL